jgi:serine/threonine protein kinase
MRDCVWLAARCASYIYNDARIQRVTFLEEKDEGTMDNPIESLRGGQRVGRFEILDSLHKGGQAVVYLARPWQPENIAWSKLMQQITWHGATPHLIEQQRLCVLKIAQPDARDHLINEWDYLSRPKVNHERLIQTFTQRFGIVFSSSRRHQNDLHFIKHADKQRDVLELPYIALAYEPGGSLKQELERQHFQPLTPACAVRISIQVAEVLHHLHDQAHLVHHDISPSNILLRQRTHPVWPSEPDAVVIDLAAADSIERPRMKVVFGKKVYLPPERLRRESPVLSPQIDIYSLGMVLYEMLAGRLPDQSSTEILDTEHQLPPIREKNPRVSPALNDLVMQVVDHKQERREEHIPTMGVFLERLKQLPEASQSCRLRGDWALPQVRFLAIRAAIILLVVVAVALGGGYTYVALSGTETDPAISIEETAEAGNNEATSRPTATLTPEPTETPTQTPVAPTATSIAR